MTTGALFSGGEITLTDTNVELVNAPSLNLVKYDLPPYVQLAKQAGIFGEVRSRIISDAQTNLVKSVQLVSGHLMLGNPAVNVAKNGDFLPEHESIQAKQS
jgi:hypothetical protein